MTTDQLNQLINIVASITLFEMMVAIGLGVTVADVLRVAAVCLGSGSRPDEA